MVLVDRCAGSERGRVCPVSTVLSVMPIVQEHGCPPLPGTWAALGSVTL